MEKSCFFQLFRESFTFYYYLVHVFVMLSIITNINNKILITDIIAENYRTTAISIKSLKLGSDGLG